MHRLKTIASAIIVALVVITCVDYAASAATGGKFILGKINQAGAVSTLKRTTAGPALKLNTTSSYAAPLLVNGRGKVVNLNADKLDGLDSSQIRTGSYVFKKTVSVAATDVNVAISLPAGTYLMGYSTYMTGGGLDNGEAACYFVREQGISTTYYGLEKMSTKTGDNPAMSGNGILSVGPGVTLTLSCYADAAWTADGVLPIQITATRTAVIGGGNLRIAPDSRVAPRH